MHHFRYKGWYVTEAFNRDVFPNSPQFTAISEDNQTVKADTLHAIKCLITRKSK